MLKEIYLVSTKKKEQNFWTELERSSYFWITDFVSQCSVYSISWIAWLCFDHSRVISCCFKYAPTMERLLQRENPYTLHCEGPRCLRFNENVLHSSLFSFFFIFYSQSIFFLHLCTSVRIYSVQDFFNDWSLRIHRKFLFFFFRKINFTELNNYTANKWFKKNRFFYLFWEDFKIDFNFFEN